MVKGVSRLQVARLIGKFKAGKYAQLPKWITHYSTDRVKIICDKPTPVNLDGELLTAQVVDIRLAQEKVRFFYPKGLVWRNKIHTKV